MFSTLVYTALSLFIIETIVHLISEVTAHARIAAIEERMDKANGKLARQSVTLEAWKVRMAREITGYNDNLKELNETLLNLSVGMEILAAGEVEISEKQEEEHFENFKADFTEGTYTHIVDGEEIVQK